MSPARRRALAGLLVAVTSACSLQPADVETRRKLIERMPPDAPLAPPLAAILLVLGPSASPEYDTTRMAYTTRPYELAYFARTEWAQPPARMLHALLVRTLERSGRFRMVASPPFEGHPTYTLAIELVELRQDFTLERPTLRLVTRVALRDAAGGSLATTREFEAIQPMGEKSPDAGAVAANDAAARLVADIARFVVQEAR